MKPEEQIAQSKAEDNSDHLDISLVKEEKITRKFKITCIHLHAEITSSPTCALHHNIQNYEVRLGLKEAFK